MADVERYKCFSGTMVPDEEGTWVPKNDAVTARLRARVTELEAVHAQIQDILTEIARGAGAFSHDPLEHAANCIEAMKELAKEAIQAGGEASQ